MFQRLSFCVVFSFVAFYLYVSLLQKEIWIHVVRQGQVHMDLQERLDSLSWQPLLESLKLYYA